MAKKSNRQATRAKRPKTGSPSSSSETKSYSHPEAQSLLRPDVGTQAHFRKKKPVQTYRYDSSLSPLLDWDGQNSIRELGEWLLMLVEKAALLPPPHVFEKPQQFFDGSGRVLATVRGLHDAVDQLKNLGRPFLNWAGKAERLSFDVPTLPLFVHERLSTKAILETLKGHRRDKQVSMLDLFGDPQHPIHEQILGAYEYPDGWTNRLILGDSLVVMNSLLRYEGLGGQVQMIYMDPPYAVNYGSNFQPFVRKRSVSESNEDGDMTREPEMVKAYRDTWELGLHSYLTYLRDRLLLCRELLASRGSIFVQTNDENFPYVRDLMGEVFGPENFVVSLLIKKKGGQKGQLIDPVNDYVIWYAKDIDTCRRHFHQLYMKAELDADLVETFRLVELPDGRELSLVELSEERGVDYTEQPERVLADFPGARIFKSENLTSGGYRRTQSVIYKYGGNDYDPGIAKGNCWKHSAITDDGSPSGMDRLAATGRLYVGDRQLGFKRYHTDFGYKAISNWWDRLGGAAKPIYVVQTNPEIIKRCMLMTTDPGDLVLDPTCGSGTTAYVAEQWGRRWITIDTSRVPLALTRQRLLAATFSYYRLKDESRGPAGGFVYARKQNNRGEEVGGIAPHITSSTIANNEPPKEEVMVDRPERNTKITRVTGPFCVEATIPTSVEWGTEGTLDTTPVELKEYGSFVDRMLEVLRKSPILHLGGGKTVTLKNVRPPAKTLSLSAEAFAVIDDEKPVAIVFGPENGAITEKLVFESAREAYAKNYSHLYVIGFAIQANARSFVERCSDSVGVPATYVQATPDLMMGDLLKNMRSSQIFSVCGLPEVRINVLKPKSKDDPLQYQVNLVGLDVFDPGTMELVHQGGDNVPAWFLDTDYNGLCFHVCQAFFPRTAAWDDLKKALKGEYADSIWEHLAGTTSTPFEAGENGQIAIKVIDDRGNELMVIKSLKEAQP